MNVCLIARFFDLRNGGIGRYSQEMLKGLGGKCQTATVSTKRTGRMGYFWFSAVQVPFKLPKADVYHAMSPIEAIHIRKKKNSIVTFHDLIPMLYLGLTKTHYAKGVIGRFITKRYFTFACKRAVKCGAIITNSELTKKQMVEHFNVDESKIHITPFGIDPSFVPTHKRDGVFRIGTLSYLDRRKRVDLLINAFRELETQTDNVELVIGGKGDDMERLKSLAVGTNTRFAGFVPDEELCDFYNSLDMFVFPSILEGQGLPMIEAMACGKPVVTLEDAIMPNEVKGRTTVATPEGLVKTLLKIRDSGYNESKENIEWARSHRWEKTVAETVEIYEEVAN